MITPISFVGNSQPQVTRVNAMNTTFASHITNFAGRTNGPAAANRSNYPLRFGIGSGSGQPRKCEIEFSNPADRFTYISADGQEYRLNCFA